MLFRENEEDDADDEMNSKHRKDQTDFVELTCFGKL